MDKSKIQNYLDKQINFIESLNESSDKINQIYNNLLGARNSKKNIFLMGNGGSASTASHFTADLLKTSIVENENRFTAYSLTDNIPVILAWANDDGYENILSHEFDREEEMPVFKMELFAKKLSDILQEEVDVFIGKIVSSFDKQKESSTEE